MIKIFRGSIFQLFLLRITRIFYVLQFDLMGIVFILLPILFLSCLCDKLIASFDHKYKDIGMVFSMTF